jgi:hypothetical protein
LYQEIHNAAMKRLLMVGLFVLVMAVFAPSGLAQEQTVSCDPSSVALTLTALSEIMANLEARIDTDTPDAVKTDLRTARTMMLDLRISCFEDAPMPQPVTYSIFSNQGVNARSCPQISCQVVFVLSPGDVVQPISTVIGDTVSGSSDWYQIVVNTDEAYVHSSLVRENPQATPVVSPTSTPTQP